MPKSTLMPCPFCGGEPSMVHTEVWWLVCDGESGCHAEGPFMPTEAQAITAWNTRITVSRVDEPKRNAILEEAAEQILALRQF